MKRGKERVIKILVKWFLNLIPQMELDPATVCQWGGVCNTMNEQGFNDEVRTY
jgi:hypothetical protein